MMYVFASPLFLFELWSNHITVRIMTLPCVDIVACIFSSLLIPCPTAVHCRLLSHRNSYRDHAMNMQLPCNIHEIPLASCTCWFGVLTAVLTPSSILNLTTSRVKSLSHKVSKDMVLKEKLALTSFVRPEHLDIPPECCQGEHIKMAEKELCKMDAYKARHICCPHTFATYVHSLCIMFAPLTIFDRSTSLFARVLERSGRLFS